MQAPVDLVPETSGWQARHDRVVAYLERQLDEQKIPGLGVAVVLDGRLVWSRGFGTAEVEQNIPVDARTVFRFGSLSRMMTATAVLHLVQQGKITLHTDIREFVPELPDKDERITVEHLLTAPFGRARVCAA